MKKLELEFEGGSDSRGIVSEFMVEQNGKADKKGHKVNEAEKS